MMTNKGRQGEGDEKGQERSCHKRMKNKWWQKACGEKTVTTNNDEGIMTKDMQRRNGNEEMTSKMWQWKDDDQEAATKKR